MKPLIYKTKDMENKLIVKRYKIPEDLLMDILRILFGNNIKSLQYKESLLAKDHAYLTSLLHNH